VLGSWGFTETIAVGVDIDLQHARKYPWLEMQTLYPFSEDGTAAAATAMAMKTVKVDHRAVAENWRNDLGMIRCRDEVRAERKRRCKLETLSVVCFDQWARRLRYRRKVHYLRGRFDIVSVSVFRLRRDPSPPGLWSARTLDMKRKRGQRSREKKEGRKASTGWRRSTSGAAGPKR